MISFVKRLFLITVIAAFVGTIVEFALIQKHGATLNTLIIIIATVTIPIILAMAINIWYWYPKYKQK
jgi:uncharacterized membrane protein